MFNRMTIFGLCERFLWFFNETLLLFTDVLIISNGIAMSIRIMESIDNLSEGAKNFCASWDTFLFLICKYFLLKSS